MKRNRDYLEKPLPDWVSGTAEERFTRIYERCFWGEPDSVSGPGSVPEQTRVLIRELPPLLSRLGVRTLLDIPCGDFNWMRELELELDWYVGGDIVAALIASNQQRYGRPGREFRRLDLTRDSLPRADLILCRDCLVHLSFADIARAVERIRASGSTWLLTTTFPSREINVDIVTGDWRPLNLEAPPLCFPPPELVLNEGCPEPGYEDKSLGLWRVKSLDPLEP
ncbi:MAG: class I SAM-dependent methyltransferase [Acidobacteriota bacterium]